MLKGKLVIKSSISKGSHINHNETNDKINIHYEWKACNTTDTIQVM